LNVMQFNNRKSCRWLCQSFFCFWHL